MLCAPILLLLTGQPLRLESSSVVAEVSPSLGRLTYLGPPGGPNLLWTNPDPTGNPGKNGGWANYGGDKLWPAPQANWTWPPPKTLDGSPHRAARRGDTIELTSGICPATGLQFHREFRLGKTPGEILITNRMTNRGKKTATWSIWQITQVDDPTSVTLPRAVSFAFPRGWREYPNALAPPENVLEGKTTVDFTRNLKAGYKVAGNAQPYRIDANWVGRKTMLRLSMHTKAVGPFPDDGAPLQVFSNADPDGYMELEVAGPLTKLRPGQSTELRTSLTVSRIE